MELNGSGALVTGGASGLAEATVRRLAKAGAHVTIPDFDEARARTIVDELGPPDEYASLVEYICTNKMLNGSVIRLDAGIRFTPR